MIIPKGYVLSNEIAEKGDIHIANFSMFQKLTEDQNIRNATYKCGNCTFINPNSIDVPNNFKNIIRTHKFTKMDNMFLTSFTTKYWGCEKEEMLAMDEAIGEVIVAGKSFIEFKESFVNTLRNRVVTNITYKDFKEYEKDLLGHVKINKNNYLVWY